MLAEIICIGDELLIGQTINTNAAWLGDALNKSGIQVHRVHTISDDPQAILSMVDECLLRSKVVVMTGGLGPTKDDLTKHTLCDYFGSHLVMNNEALERIESFMRVRQLPILEVNRQQAALPHNCRVIQNYKGTACGMWFEKNGHVLVSMPGVPYEMQAMMSEEVIPSLQSKFALPHITHRTLLTIGVGESFLAQQIADWENSLAAADIKLAYLPSPGSVKLRMSHYGGGDTAAVAERFARKESELRHLIGDCIYGQENDTIAGVVGQLLRDRNLTLATAESCTGGHVGHLLTSIPGSSAYYKGGMITYTNAIKTAQLGVPEEEIAQFGVVSNEIATAMAQQIRKKFSADFGIGITGIAGPDGGSEATPVGTVCIAVSSSYGEFVKKEVLGRSRERTIQVASHFALNYLRKEILRTDAC
jgi:nicotinamide-nucleotide amidase